MKKFITLALVLAFALSLAAPAMAFTGASQKSSEYAYDLQIKLVDVSDGLVTVNFSAPPTNRGYLKNEVVCAVVTLFVPGKSKIAEHFDHLKFTGTNVDVYQSQNFYGAYDPGTGNNTLAFMSNNAWQVLGNGTANFPHFSYQDLLMNNELRLRNSGLVNMQRQSSDQTYYFAYFARITADNAYVRATLSGKGSSFEPGYGDIVVALDGNGDYDDTALAGITSMAQNSTDGTTNDLPGGYVLYLYDPNDYTDAWIDMDYDLLQGTVPHAKVWEEDVDGTDVANMDDILGSLVGATELGYLVVDPERKNTDKANENLFLIVTDKNFKCQRMYIFDPDMGRVGDVLEGDTDPFFEDHGYTSANAPGADDSSVDLHSKSELVAFRVTFSQTDNWVQFASTTAVRAAYAGADATASGNGPYNLSGNDMTPKSSGFDLTLYGDLLGVLEDVVEDYFGFDVSNANGYLYLSWWEDFAKKGSISVEQAVEPWYAEVTVPPEIEIDPPKTGDAMNILGFVMIALAGLAVVAVRKVRA